MRIVEISANPRPLSDWPEALPARGEGFLWVSMARREFEVQLPHTQAALQRLVGTSLLELHASDVLNAQLPSSYDYTAVYDVVVFRRLAAGDSERELSGALVSNEAPREVPAAGRWSRRSRKAGAGSLPMVLRRIDTSPVGFLVFDRLLITVHPVGCGVHDHFVSRALGLGLAPEDALVRGAWVRAPANPPELMLRIVNHMVDGYLDLRRQLASHLERWQADLLNPRSRFRHFSSLLEARNTIHQLEEVCEDQRAAMSEFLDTLGEPAYMSDHTERELLQVRTRDVIEHIERVLNHVRRMENSLESAVQIHFSAQANRTNDIMRTLTALTAIFLPLNLITGVFGMNFEVLPLLSDPLGFWIATAMMGAVAAGMLLWFWSRRYID
jgi:Mg2+ and Co2+ transporter CorA